VAILITGGAGFIGSAFLHSWFLKSNEPAVTLDLLTYAGNTDNFIGMGSNAAHTFIHGDIGDRALLRRVLAEHQPRAIVHFAAETHVDRSIMDADAFLQTNVVGTGRLLDETTTYWRELPADRQRAFRFLHVSTDEVFGSLSATQAPFNESSQYQPSSPYAASKAGSDHVVSAWHITHGLPVLTTHCSNNYGPRQFPEKLIPLCIARATAGESIPIYGSGTQVRDWLHVYDHCAALRLVLDRGAVGRSYAIGGYGETTNIELVRTLCGTLDQEHPRPNGISHSELIRFVTDRPGHDARYAIDPSRIRDELGWKPAYGLTDGLKDAVRWYLDNGPWLDRVRSGEYRSWVRTHYSQ
jgi:dTDP-glucose 4,6-dehydratase